MRVHSTRLAPRRYDACARHAPRSSSMRRVRVACASFLVDTTRVRGMHLGSSFSRRHTTVARRNRQCSSTARPRWSASGASSACATAPSTRHASGSAWPWQGRHRPRKRVAFGLSIVSTGRRTCARTCPTLTSCVSASRRLRRPRRTAAAAAAALRHCRRAAAAAARACFECLRYARCTRHTHTRQCARRRNVRGGGGFLPMSAIVHRKKWEHRSTMSTKTMMTIMMIS